MGDNCRKGETKDLPICGDTMVNDRPGSFGESVSNHQHFFSQALLPYNNLRFDTPTNKIHSPGGADERTGDRILENHGFNCLKSRVRFDGGQYSFPRVSVHLGRVDRSTEEGVIEHVVYTRDVIGAVLCGAMDVVPRDSLGVMGLASISAMKAAKRPIL